MEESIPEKTHLGVPGWLSRVRVQLLISAQVMISSFVSLSPASGSVLTARNLLDILSRPVFLEEMTFKLRPIE